MAAFKVPFKILQGETYNEVSTWKPGGIPADLTGCTARAQVRKDIKSTTVLLNLTTENGRIELGGAAGTIRRIISDEDTAALSFESGVWDLEIVFGNGTVRRLMAGSVSVSKEVTRG